MTIEKQSLNQTIDRVVTKEEAWDMIFRSETFISLCADQIIVNVTEGERLSYDQVISELKSKWKASGFENIPGYDLRLDGLVEVSYTNDVVDGELFKKVTIESEEDFWEDMFHGEQFEGEWYQQLKDNLMIGHSPQSAQRMVERRWKQKGVNSFANRYLRSDGTVETNVTK